MKSRRDAPSLSDDDGTNIACLTLKRKTRSPFTLKSDQFQNSPAASQEIWNHTVWRTWLFIAYSDEKWLYYKFSLHHSYNRFLKGWENTLFELRSERVKLIDWWAWGVGAWWWKGHQMEYQPSVAVSMATLWPPNTRHPSHWTTSGEQQGTYLPRGEGGGRSSCDWSQSSMRTAKQALQARGWQVGPASVRGTPHDRRLASTSRG